MLPKIFLQLINKKFVYLEILNRDSFTSHVVLIKTLILRNFHKQFMQNLSF